MAASGKRSNHNHNHSKNIQSSSTGRPQDAGEAVINNDLPPPMFTVKMERVLLALCSILAAVIGFYSHNYNDGTASASLWNRIMRLGGNGRYYKNKTVTVQDRSAHPLVFAALRESVLAFEGGFVHPDLGILMPAPSGADRGLGMVRSSYAACECSYDNDINEDTYQGSDDKCDREDTADSEVLLKIPLGAQMTRSVAMQTLKSLIPIEKQKTAPLNDLDDAALLVLLLAHEKGKGPESRFLPYIVSLPKDPTCGYSPDMRNKAIDIVATLLDDKYGADVNGWPAEISKAADYAERIALSLAHDYGQFIKVPKRWKVTSLLQWSLCTVASRATGGSWRYGSLRLVPILDMINHDISAGGFVELLGHERIIDGDLVNATEDDAGTFVVRSVKNGKPHRLSKGMELLANYNVPDYSPLDWFLNLGFIPPERQTRWTFVESALPKINGQKS